jgi:hypothetical protein
VEAYRKAGENCVLRGIVNNQVWLAQSVIVVNDLQPGFRPGSPKDGESFKISPNQSQPDVQKR